MMDYTYIEQLLEKYFDGATSLEEEQILRAFFSQSTLPGHLEKYGTLFRAQTWQKTAETLSEDFDLRILQLAGQAEAEGTTVHAQQAQQQSERRSLSESLRPLYRAVAMVAVVLAIGQAAQMPYHDSTVERQKDMARTYEMLQQLRNTQGTMAKGDTAAATTVAVPAAPATEVMEER